MVNAFLLTPIRLVEGGENQLYCGWEFKKLKVSGKQFLLRLRENPKSGSQNTFQEKGFSGGLPVPPQVATGMMFDVTSYLDFSSKGIGGKKWNYCKVLKRKQN